MTSVFYEAKHIFLRSDYKCGRSGGGGGGRQHRPQRFSGLVLFWWGVLKVLTWLRSDVTESWAESILISFKTKMMLVHTIVSVCACWRKQEAVGCLVTANETRTICCNVLSSSLIVEVVEVVTQPIRKQMQANAASSFPEVVLFVHLL